MMFDELWAVIADFPHFYIGQYAIEICVPLQHYRRIREAATRHLKKYPGERLVLTLDML